MSSFSNNRATDCAEKVRAKVESFGYELSTSASNVLYSTVYAVLDSDEFLKRQDPLPPILEPKILSYCRELRSGLQGRDDFSAQVINCAILQLHRVLEEEMVPLTAEELQDLVVGREMKKRQAAKRASWGNYAGRGKYRGTKATNRTPPKRRKRNKKRKSNK